VRWIAGMIIGVAIVIVAAVTIIATMQWNAARPGHLESSIMTRVKYWRIGGEDLVNPVADTEDAVRMGADHFQHHCHLCHGLDGQNSGVPFAEKMSPAAADLASRRVQQYKDGQLKGIIDNGIRFSGMPGWKGVLDDDEMWHIVRYIRHLPTRGV
jgi:mono/diheme cytochrome c family protein